MELLTVDWETYYDKEYSLSRKDVTTESYIRDTRFEPIMLGLRFPDDRRQIITGTKAEIQAQIDEIEWSRYAVLAHNTLFDGAILSWHFGVRPAAWLDTLSMARAMFGGGSLSLGLLAKRYGMQDKLDTVGNMMGRRRETLSKSEFEEYAIYCLRDIDICHDLFKFFMQGWYDLRNADLRDPFPQTELEIIDQIIRMYTEPTLKLNREMLVAHLEHVLATKEELLNSCVADKEELTSNPKFADLLIRLGVVPPTKISPTTKKTTWAFAKTDPGLKELQEHPDLRVQAVVAARLGTKSTLEETRTERFIGIADRNDSFPIPLKYAAARTHRLGGMDSINLQNLPSRGKGANKLKECIVAPDGYVMFNSDSSNIEARMLAWLAGQDDLVNDFANGVDVYCKMSTRIYNRTITKEDKLERFVGKTVVLGCGYQTGKYKLQVTLKAADPPMELELAECERIVDTYRATYRAIPALWEESQKAIIAMIENKTMWIGKEGVVRVEGRNGIRLPNGLYLKYPELQSYFDKETGYTNYKYKDIKGWIDLYGGKLTENIIQALARIIVMNQLLKISRRYRVVLTVHDSVVAIAKKEEKDEAFAYIEKCMRWVPKWAAGCPINCETNVGYNYAEC